MIFEEFGKSFDESVRLKAQRTFAYTRWIRNIYSSLSDEELQEVVEDYRGKIFLRFIDEIGIFPSRERMGYDAALKILQERKSLEKKVE